MNIIIQGNMLLFMNIIRYTGFSYNRFHKRNRMNGTIIKL